MYRQTQLPLLRPDQSSHPPRSSQPTAPRTTSMIKSEARTSHVTKVSPHLSLELSLLSNITPIGYQKERFVQRRSPRTIRYSFRYHFLWTRLPCKQNKLTIFHTIISTTFSLSFFITWLTFSSQTTLINIYHSPAVKTNLQYHINQSINQYQTTNSHRSRPTFHT